MWGHWHRVPTTVVRRDTASRVPAVALREEFIGAKISGIKGEGESVTKVSYFKGNDPSQWKSNISTYQLVNLGEIYEGIELKLKAHGNNVEKLLYVKPGADPGQINIRLSGMKECGSRNVDCGIENPKSEFQNRKLQINPSGELEVETALGTVAFTKPIAYQEIDGKRVEVECAYTIAECVTNFEFGFWNLDCFPYSAFRIAKSTTSASPNPNSAIQNQNTVSPSPPTTKPKTSSSIPCWHPRSWAGLMVKLVILSPSTPAGTYM